MKNKKLLFNTLASLLFATGAMAQVPGNVPTNGLVAYYPFDGNVNDASGNGYNGTANSTVSKVEDRFGNPNSAYYTNYDALAKENPIITTCPGVLGTNSRTMNIWMKTDEVSSTYMAPFGYGSRFKQGGRFSCTFNFLTPGVTIDCAESAITYESHTPINNNKWSMYTWVFDNINGSDLSTVKVYQNGVLLTNVLKTFNPKTVINTVQELTLRFGGYNQHIDDAGIWNRALTEQEITSLYLGCSFSSQPVNQTLSTGTDAQFSAPHNITNATYQWQTNPNNVGWQNLPENTNYTGTKTKTLTVKNVQLSNHLQPFRAIAISGTCTSTSDIATLSIANTCTNYITVTDALLINVTLLGISTPDYVNTIKVYPNPAKDHITIDNGNYNAMNGYSIKIQNSLGQTLFSQQVNQAQFYIDLSTWSGNGLYFIQIIDPSNNTIDTRKIIIE